MPGLAEFADALRRIPEIRVLATCATRCRIRFTLKGPVSDLFLRFHDWIDRPVSLYEFVAPLDPLTFLLDHEDDHALLMRAVGDSLPLSGFYRWGTDLWSRLREAGSTEIPVDSLVIQFDGTTGGSAEITVKSTVGADGVIEKYLNDVRFDPLARSWQRWQSDPITRYDVMLVSTLRLARYQFGYPGNTRPISSELLFQARGRVLDTYSQLGPDWPSPPATTMAVEAGILNVLFTAIDLPAALHWLRGLASLLPRSWLGQSSVLPKVVLHPHILEAARIGAVVRDQPFRAEVLLRQVALDSQTAGPESIIPWTPIGFDTGGWEDDCCRYRDFRFPPTLIAWRPGEGHELSLGEIERYATVVRWRRQDDDEVRSIPGALYRRDSVIVARMDHGYARTVAGPDAWLDFGIVRGTEEEP